MIKVFAVIFFVQAAAHAADASLTALWAFPTILFAAFLIAWGAEAAQFVVSQGMALALLAWLQTMPEFAVEATISWGAATGATSNHGEPYTTHMITQNFTGSIRLLVGVGMPLVFFCRYMFAKDRSKDIKLLPDQAVEVASLIPILIYFVYVCFKGTFTIFDSVALISIYAGYLLLLRKLPPEELEGDEDLPYVSKKILSLPGRMKYAGIFAVFLLGGGILLFCAEPFVDSVIDLAPVIGISSALAIQYIAPFLSEFPEKVTVFNWARQGGKKATMGVMNIFSSNINQWTVLVGMIPIVYCLGKGGIVTIELDHDQRQEVVVTLLQSILCFFMLADLRFSRLDALGLFVLFVIQFLGPVMDPWLDQALHGRISVRSCVAAIYVLWIVVELVQYLTRRKNFMVIKEFVRMWRTHVVKKNKAGG